MHNINDLERAIVEKNTQIESLEIRPFSNRERIRKLKRELDTLLYQYYGWIRSGNLSFVMA